MSEKTQTNWLAISTLAVLVLAVVLGAMAFNSMSKRIDDNERVVSDGLRSDIPEPFDATHIPCKKCRGHLNDVASHTAAIERAEVIYMLKRNRTGHAAFDLGVNKCIDLIEERGN